MMTTGKALLGVLAGLAAGAALGVIFAPKKGSDLRKKLSGMGKELADSVNDKVEEKFKVLVGAMSHKAEQAKGLLADVEIPKI